MFHNNWNRINWLTLLKRGLLIIILTFLLYSPVSARSTGVIAYQNYFLTLPNNYYNYSSTLYLRNISTTNATNLAYGYYNPSGTLVFSSNDIIPAGGTIVRPLSGFSSLSSGSYSLVISSDQPIESLASVMHGSGDQVAFISGQTGNSLSSTASAAMATKNYFGLFYNNSYLYLFNPYVSDATVMVNFHSREGIIIGTAYITICAICTYSLNGSSVSPNLPEGVYYAVVSSSQPLIGMLRNSPPGQSDFEMQSIQSLGSLQAWLPRALKSYDDGGGPRTTQLFLANTGSSSAIVSITYTNSTGSHPHTNISINPGGFWYSSLGNEDILPSGSFWAVSATSDQPIIIGGITGLDTPPGTTSFASYIGISTSDPDTLDIPYLENSTDHFSVISIQNQGSSSTTASIKYYNLSDQLENTQSFSIAAGSLARINLKTSGELTTTQGSAVVTADIPISASVDMFVNSGPLPPDLSSSYMMVDQSNITQIPETLTYTLVLRNTGQTAASASLSNPIPDHTSFIPGSSTVSDGSTVNVTSGILSWTGVLGIDNPVTIQYQVNINDALAITNTASLKDGVGVTTQMSVISNYNTGFSFSINDGALYTNQNTVKLTYHWDTSKNIIQFQVSNDGGFPKSSSTSSWMPVNSVSPTYSNWQLESLPNTVLSRIVYIHFKDGNGQTAGPYQDDIILDTTPPQISQVQVLTSTYSGISSQDLQATIQVTAGDDVSGVGKVQVSNQAGFSSYSEFAAVGSMTDIPWQLQPSGKVYVRVVDRAGNYSTVSIGQGPTSPTRVYLPLVIR